MREHYNKASTRDVISIHQALMQHAKSVIVDGITFCEYEEGFNDARLLNDLGLDGRLSVNSVAKVRRELFGNLLKKETSIEDRLASLERTVAGLVEAVDRLKVVL